MLKSVYSNMVEMKGILEKAFLDPAEMALGKPCGFFGYTLSMESPQNDCCSCG